MSYWQDRMLEAQKKWSDKSIDEINAQLLKYYKSAMQSTIRDFEAVYDKVLTQAEDNKPITPADLYKLDKYYQIQAQLKNRLQKLGDKSCAAMSAEFEREYKHIYSALTIDSEGQAIKAMVSDIAFSSIDEEAAKYVASQIWCADGKSWSQRVWGNMDELQQTLNDGLIDCIVSGKKTSDLKNLLIERFNVGYHRAETITRTEIAHIETQAAKDRYKNYGIEKVQILADTDSRTCDVCAKLDGKEFDINAKIPIPAHPNCRCCIIPVVNEPKTEQTTTHTCARCGKKIKGDKTYCKDCITLFDKRWLDNVKKSGYEYDKKSGNIYSTTQSHKMVEYNFINPSDNLMYYCIDCGKPFYTKNRKSVAQKRCPECQAKYRKEYKAQKEKERRAKAKKKKK